MTCDESSHDDSSDLAAAIAEYLEAAERGETPDLQAFLEKYPACAEELGQFLDDHHRLWQAAQGVPFGQPGLTTPGSQDQVTTDQATLPRRPHRGSSFSLPGVGQGQPVPFGEYELVEEIARGGMGVVYRACQPRLNRTVALKMILRGNLAEAAEIRRFQSEAGAAARLEHTGIVPIHEIGQQDGLHYYTMSLIDGQSLAQILAGGPLPPVEAARLVQKIAEAIAYAHEHQVIHRDLKPANILVTPQGDPRITDFGLAKCLDRGEMLTATGQILGTLQYMAPEQAVGNYHDISVQTDVYGLGAILYAALTGQAPHPGSSPVDLLLRVMESEPPAPRTINPLVPRELERICRRCLEKSPQRRYATAAELARDLELVLRGEQPLGVRSGFVEFARRLPRRMPALSAHLGAIASVELLRQGRWLFSDPGPWPDEWTYHWQFTGIFLLWSAACVLFHFLLEKPTTTEWGRYLWAGADALFLTWILLLARGPVAPLYPAFALLIVAAGSLFRVRLIVFMTILSSLSFLVVTHLRADEFHPPRYLFVTVGILVVIGVIMGYHVRRLRKLYEYFQRPA